MLYFVLETIKNKFLQHNNLYVLYYRETVVNHTTVSTYHEDGTIDIGLAMKYIDTNLQGKCDIQECKQYRDIKLDSHTLN